ncbi:hypothetical protein FACS1894111_06800 [Clostridia bacterium]|nr:hypothetical protein FACS1894111_06800 [Clostridia bacterium]
MYFSKNRKISIRQSKRMLLLNLFGISSLLLPNMLAKQVGSDGIFCILLGGVLAFFYVCILEKCLCVQKSKKELKFNKQIVLDSSECVGKDEKESKSDKKIVLDRNEYMQKAEKKSKFDQQISLDSNEYLFHENEKKNHFVKAVFRILCLVFCLIFCCTLAAYILYQLERLIQISLLPDANQLWILILLLLFAVYVILQGAEGRARVYEILFPVLLVPFLIMLLFAIPGVDVTAFFPIFSHGILDFFKGVLLVFVFFLPLTFCLLEQSFCAEPEGLAASMKQTVLLVTVVNAVLYMILLGSYGEKSLALLPYPVISLMGMIRLPGGMLTGVDVFLSAVWFFALFCLMNTGVFYGKYILEKLFGKWHRERWDLVESKDMSEGMKGKNHGKGRRQKLALSLTTVFVFVLSLLFLSACGGKELESLNFPLAIALDRQEDKTVLSFDFPDLAQVSKGKAKDTETEVQKPPGFSVEAGNYKKAQENYAASANKNLDYNHVKALVISEDLLGNEAALLEFLEWAEKDNLFASNTCLFSAEKGAGIVILDKGDENSIGSYLEEMDQRQTQQKANTFATLGDLFQNWHNGSGLLLIPFLKNEGGYPVISDYAVLDGMSYQSKINMEEGRAAQLLGGMLKELYPSLESEESIQIKGIKVSREIREEGGHPVVWIKITGKTEQSAASQTEGAMVDTVASQIEGNSFRQMEEHLNAQIAETLTETANRLLLDKDIDITNSYHFLGRYDRNLYEKYKEDYSGYKQGLVFRFTANVKLVQSH